MNIGFYDGACNPNPGKIGLGVCILDSKGKEILCGAAPGGHGTNNEAEYMALIWLLELALQSGIPAIRIYGDSQLITNQVNGIWSVGKDTLKPFNSKVTELAKQFKSIEFVWIPRTKNTRADQLSKRGVELSAAKVANKYTPATIETKQEKASSQSVATPVTYVAAKVSVKSLGDGVFSILEMQHPMITLNTNKGTCTCGSFALHGDCKHIESFKRCIV